LGVALGLVLLALAGCGAPGASAAVVVLPIASVTPEPPTAPSPVSPEPTPPPLDVPGEMGCTYPSSGELRLRFRGGARPFAVLAVGSTLVDLSTAGPAAGAYVRRAQEGYTLTGIVAGDEISLGPAHAMVIAGFLVPTPDARFAWQGAAPGKVLITIPVDDDVRVLPEAKLGPAVSLDCDAVSLEGASFDAASAAPRSPRQRQARLRSGKAIPLSRTVGGPPVAELAVRPDDGDSVTLVETRGGRALVVRAGVRAIVFGWIPLTFVDPGEFETFGRGGLALRPESVGGGSAVREVVRCDHEVPLVAEVDGERRTVGSVAAGTSLRLLERTGAVVPLLFPRTLVVHDPEARLGVLASHVAACEKTR
jgi:hypothetical protein